MSHYNTILQQLLTHILRHQFQTLVNRYPGDRYAKTFTTWNQLTVLLYAQASGQDSLRDIEQSLDTQRAKTYHVGLPGHVGRSTLSDANERRNWEIFKGLFGTLVERCGSVTPNHQPPPPPSRGRRAGSSRGSRSQRNRLQRRHLSMPAPTLRPSGSGKSSPYKGIGF